MTDKHLVKYVTMIIETIIPLIDDVTLLKEELLGLQTDLEKIENEIYNRISRNEQLKLTKEINNDNG